MKQTVICLALLLSSHAFAGTPQEAYNAKSMSYQVNGLIQATADNLSDAKLQQIEALLTQVQGIALNLAPLPTPTPVPVLLPQMLIKGSMQSHEYTFTVRSLNELSDQCTNFVTQNNLSQVDRIETSINLNPTQVSTNGADYWKTANEMCGQVIAIAATSGLTVDPSLGKTVAGTIQGHDYKFVGVGIIAIDNQCENFVTRNNLTSVDTISVSVDFKAPRMVHNGADYWHTSFDICQQIVPLAR